VTAVSHSLALRTGRWHQRDGSEGGNTLATVQDALGKLVAPYGRDEVLTAVQHIPAREAQFRPMPAWVKPEIVTA